MADDAGEQGSPKAVSCPWPQRNHPVHPQPVDLHNVPVILFVTFAIQPREPYLANAPFHDAFCGACADADAWSVGFYLIMPDHIHLFCRPAKEPRVLINRWSSFLKERITKRSRVKIREDGSPQVRPPNDGYSSMEGEAVLSRIPWKWQPDCWDTQMRSGRHYHEKWDYILLNPARKNLCIEGESWPWQGVLNVLEW